MRLKEASEYLSLSCWQLRRIVQAGQLPVVKVGGDGAPWLLDLKDLDAFIERSKVKID